MRTCAPVAHQRDISVARVDEEAAQVSVLHVGQDHQGHRRSTVLLSLEGDTCRTAAVTQLSRHSWHAANSLTPRAGQRLTEEPDHVLVVKVPHELSLPEELLQV